MSSEKKYPIKKTCHKCSGKGYVVKTYPYKTECSFCDGKGYKWTSKLEDRFVKFVLAPIVFSVLAFLVVLFIMIILAILLG